MFQISVDSKQNVYVQSYYLRYQGVFPLNISEEIEIIGYEKPSKL